MRLNQKGWYHRRYLRCLLVIMAILPLTETQPINAQPLDDKPQIPSPLPPTQPPSLDTFPSSPTTPSLEELPQGVPATITVERFQFEGNTVFSEDELAEVIAPFTNRPISFAELLQARFAISQYYIERGYVTSGAYLPPQKITDGIVTIQIIEGSLEAINVSVDGKLSPDYIRDRLALAAQIPLNTNQLLEALQLLQLNPLIDKISAELSASVHPGRSRLDVTVETAPSFDVQLVLDNGRNPQVGSFRRGLELSDLNLLGWGDSIRGSYRNTDGSDDIEVSYTFPFNARNGNIQLGFRNLTGEVIESPFDILELTSDYQKYEVKLRHPVWQTPNQDFSLGITFDYQSSSTRSPLFPVTPRGSNESGHTRIATVRFFQEWTQRSQAQVLAARSEFNFGVDAFGTTVPFDVRINPNAPNPQAFFWRGQTQWLRLLAPETFFVLRGELQIADSPLVPLEQFALGGLGTLPGYRQNTLLTDNGLFASMEFRLPLFTIPEKDAVLHFIPFIGVGTGWNNGNFDPRINTLASTGFGLQWRYRDNFNVRFDFGIPLGKVPFEGDSLQDKGITFTVIMSP